MKISYYKRDRRGRCEGREQRRRSKRREHGLIAVIVATALVISACNVGYFFSAEIAGYVKDSESEVGVDGVIVRIYLEEPASADADGFIIETATGTSGGNPGYFSHRVVWQSVEADFGAEGDSNSVWLGVAHADYVDSVAEVRGVLSDTVNYIPDVWLDRAAFTASSVTGEVVDAAGSGVNGIRIVLDVISTDLEEDYTTVTTVVAGVEGTYQFTGVTWRDDAAAGAGTDTEEVRIFVDDDEYSSDDELTVLLASDQNIEVAQSISVVRTAPTFFETTLEGRCIRESGTAPDIQELPVQGVEVTLTFTDDEGVHTLYAQSDNNGSIAFFIQWTDAEYGDFVDGIDDATIPTGEDGLEVVVTYEAPFDTSSTTRNVKSWLDPNYLPDAVQ